MKNTSLKIALICITLVIVGTAFFTIEVSATEKSKKASIEYIKNNGSGIKIKWKKVKNTTGYILYRKKQDEKLKKYDYITNSNSYLDENVETGVKYSYAVKPYKVKRGKKVFFKLSTISNEIVATPFSAKNLKTSINVDGNIHLKWETNPYSTGYYLYRTSDGSSWENIAELTGNINTYKDYEIENNKSYKYKIKSYEIVDGKNYEGVFSKESEPIMNVFGVDVSHHNGKIDWNKMKKDGVDFAMIRVGYGDNKKGGILDRKFKYNMKNAIKNDIKVGVYLYSYADSVSEAKKEAKFVVKHLKKYKLDYPVAFDFENDYRRKKKYKKENTRIIKAFCDYIIKEGYDVVVYSGSDYIRKCMDTEEISKYGLWVARWTYDKNDFKDSDLNNVKMWQYSDKGRIKGCKENIDLNIGFMQ